MKLLYILILLLLSCSTEPEDCAGVVDGSAIIDDCGLCTGGTTGNVANYLQDCAGECGGDATEDCLGECNGLALVDNCDVCDNDNSNDCIQDCGGVWGGLAVIDMCGVCDSDDANDCIQDCAGVWGGLSYEDECGGCDANMNNDCVQDECGVWGGGDVVYCSQGWICKTDYIPEDFCTAVIIVAETPDILLPIIYNSLDECESVCPNEPVAVTNACFPDGTGEYAQMYCSETD